MPDMRLRVEARCGANAPELGGRPGDPIVGATVEAVTSGLPRIITSGTTDDEGRAELHLSEPGRYAINVTFDVDGGAFVGESEISVSDPEHSLVVECRALPL